MKIILSLSIIVLLIYGGSVVAQETELGTSRTEDLQIKAKMDYERRNQKQVQVKKSQVPEPPQVAPKSSPDVTPSAPSSAPAEMQTRVSCKNGAEIRALYIDYKGNGCELFYTKFGNTKSQARQNNGTSVCESVFEKMKMTIEKSGFVCESKAN